MDDARQDISKDLLDQMDSLKSKIENFLELTSREQGALQRRVDAMRARIKERRIGPTAVFMPRMTELEEENRRLRATVKSFEATEKLYKTANGARVIAALKQYNIAGDRVKFGDLKKGDKFTSDNWDYNNEVLTVVEMGLVVDGAQTSVCHARSPSGNLYQFSNDAVVTRVY